MKRPSRLYRRLSAAGIPTPLLRVDVDGFNPMSDDEIRSIVIHRGKAGPSGGVPGSTFEMTVNGYRSSLTGASTSLTLLPAASIAGLTGANPLALTPRYSGRASTFSVHDSGKRRESTTMSATSWSALFGGHSAQFNIPGGTYVADLLTTILQPPHWPIPPVEYRGSRIPYGRLVEPIVGKTYSELISAYTTRMDILVRDKHDGTMEILSLPHRSEAALLRMEMDLPLTRSQVLAPAEWRQDMWQNRKNYFVQVSRQDGSYAGLNYGDQSDLTRTEQVIDLTDLWFVEDEHWNMLGSAHRWREYTGAYSLPSSRIDLLHLLTSEHEADRIQAGRLLELEPGDPVFLSGDWWTGIRGIQFAQEITETIGPDGWHLDLALTPYEHVIGDQGPIPPPRVWNSAAWPWDDETRTWSAA